MCCTGSIMRLQYVIPSSSLWRSWMSRTLSEGVCMSARGGVSNWAPEEAFELCASQRVPQLSALLLPQTRRRSSQLGHDSQTPPSLVSTAVNVACQGILRNERSVGSLCKHNACCGKMLCSCKKKFFSFVLLLLLGLCICGAGWLYTASS